jgi:hypothetical protein
MHPRRLSQPAPLRDPSSPSGDPVVDEGGKIRDFSDIRRPQDTPIWKLEAALKCRSCKKGRYAPPVHMIKLTEKREITPYKWVHPDEDR